MKVAVVTFPASNCERDAFTAAQSIVGDEVVKVWHQDAELPKVDLVILPGGFSYGDYLRSGAMAARSNIMQAVKKHAERGGYVLGICNGFQILTEGGLLEGALMRNQGLKFICRNLHLRVENNKTAFTKQYQKDEVVQFPVAHHDGNFYADEATLQQLNDNNQVVLRYVDANGDAENVNGSAQNIAGIINKEGNVMGLMPHPERVCDAQIGGIDGRKIFTSLMVA
jgi:phosphoribosylformylglycinamidine synthase